MLLTNLNVSRKRGIALIQVLIISIILMMLGIFIQQAVKQQVNLAYQVQDSFKLRLHLEKAESEIFAALLSHRRYRDIKSENEVVKKWNFFNEPFAINNVVTVKIQDLSSLVNLNFTNTELLRQLLNDLEYEENDSRILIDSLADWKDKDDLKHLNGFEKVDYKKEGYPRNGYLQSTLELTQIAGAQKIPLDWLDVYFTERHITTFNPLNAPSKILKAFLKNDKNTDLVLKERQQNSLTNLRFFQITGIDFDDHISFATSRFIRVELSAKLNETKLTKRFELDINPEAIKRPVVISNITWNRE